MSLSMCAGAEKEGLKNTAFVFIKPHAVTPATQELVRLSAVCCLLSVVCSLLSAVCCLLSVDLSVCCPLFAVCCLLSAVFIKLASRQ
jgi:hypothetical protein